MATFSDTLAIANNTDADFRAWGQNMSAAFDALGMFPKSADSGQINWATVARPGVNAAAGYEIRYLNDSRHGTAPLYVRIDYGTGNSANLPSISITVGKGTNGSGTILNQFLSSYLSQPQSAINSGQPFPSYFCAVDGFVGMLYRSGAVNYGLFAFLIQRTVDDTGAPNDDGLAIFVNKQSTANYAPEMRCYNYASGYALSSGNGVQSMPSYALKPFGDRGFTTGTPPAYQMYRHVCAIPQTRPLLYTVSSSVSDNLAPGTTFQVAPVGTLPRTYIVLPTQLGYFSYDRVCMIWE